MLSCRSAYPQYQSPLAKMHPLVPGQLLPISLLQIGGIDARSVQKTPAGVLVVRRGLFFVKRQRRCIVYFQKVYSLSKAQFMILYADGVPSNCDTA